MRFLGPAVSVGHTIVVCLIGRQRGLVDTIWELCTRKVKVVFSLPISRKPLGIAECLGKFADAKSASSRAHWG